MKSVKIALIVVQMGLIIYMCSQMGEMDRLVGSQEEVGTIPTLYTSRKLCDFTKEEISLMFGPNASTSLVITVSGVGNFGIGTKSPQKFISILSEGSK